MAYSSPSQRLQTHSHRMLPWRVASGMLVLLSGLSILAVNLVLQGSAPVLLILLSAIALLAPLGVLVWASAAQGQPWAVGTMIFGVVFLSDLSLRARAAGDTGLDAQSLIKFAVWATCFALLPWAWKHVKGALRHPTSLALFLFGIWAIATATYSITPGYTLAAGVAFLGLWCVATDAGARLTVGQGLAWVLMALAGALAISLVLYFVAPDRSMTPMENGRLLRLSGIFGSPNNLGRAAALAALLVAVNWLYGIRRWRLLLALLTLPTAGACLYLSGSRASLGGMVAGLYVIAANRWPWPTFSATCAGMTAGLIALFLPITFSDLVALLSRSGSASELTTFTGRTEIWAWVMSAIEREPVLGYGFATTRVLIPEGYQGPYGWTTTSAHNMWLQAWITTGAIGAVLVILSQLASLRDMVARPLPARDAVFAFVTVVGLMEAGALGPSVNLLTFFWLWAAGLQQKPPQAPDGSPLSQGGSR